MKLTERHQIPDRCKDCPTLDMMSELSNRVGDMQAEVFDAAVVDFESRDVLEIIRVISQESGQTVEEVIETIKVGSEAVRPFFDEIISKSMKKQSSIEDRAVALEIGCPGTFKMRAKDKLGCTVTAIVCGSPLMRTMTSIGEYNSIASAVKFERPDR